MAILRFTSIHKRYGSFHALKGVSLAVEEGEVFGLLGPNGAGKTSLIRIGLDIIRPDEGEVSLLGQPMSREALDQVGYLPEERGLYKKSRVLEVLVYLGRLKGLSRAEAKARSEAWLARIGLSEVADRRLEALSKGMSQKVQIAGTLLADPPLAVLDEPFSGLDPVNVELVKELIAERRAAGRTTVLSTHLMHQIEALCDRVAVIHRGERVVYGDIDTVRRERSRPAVFVRLRGELPELAGVRSVHARDGGHELLLDDGVDPPDILEALVAAGAHFAAELVRHHLLAVTDAEDRQAAVEQHLRRARAAFVAHAVTDPGFGDTARVVAGEQLTEWASPTELLAPVSGGGAVGFAKSEASGGTGRAIAVPHQIAAKRVDGAHSCHALVVFAARRAVVGAAVADHAFTAVLQAGFACLFEVAFAISAAGRATRDTGGVCRSGAELIPRRFAAALVGCANLVLAPDVAAARRAVG